MIGQTIWRFDVNRRRYLPNRTGGPIYREHWTPLEVTGETSRSWLTKYGDKAPKRGPHPGWCFNRLELERDCWIQEHRYEIYDRVRHVDDYETLRKVAELIGYEAAGLEGE